MNFRTVLLTTAAGLLLSAQAADASVNQMRYIGTLKGTQTTTWNEPRHGGAGSDDCYHVHFEQGQGSETWDLHGSQKTKVLVTRVGTGSSVSLHYGNWNPQSMGKPGIGISSQIERRHTSTESIQPGECGGTPETITYEGEDCGFTGSPAYGDLQFREGRAELHLVDHTNLYEECPLNTPDGVTADVWTAIGPKMPGADLLDPQQGLHVILGSKTFTESWHVPDSGTISAKTTVKWQLRLKRVK